MENNLISSVALMMMHSVRKLSTDS